MASALQQFFAPCPRGLEAVLVTELEAAGARNPGTVPGGVHFSGDWATCYRANLTSRVATRVLWRVGRSGYRSERDVAEAAFQLPWMQWFKVTNTIRVQVTAVQCPLRSLEYVTLAIKDAVCSHFNERCGERPSVDTRSPDVRIHAFLSADEATLYLDTSGDPLFKRGFRTQATDAPLKENLAAGILLLSGWEPGTPLLDPMCGSGAFLLEAAQMALRIAPGNGRRFAFQKLRNYDAPLWAQIEGDERAKQLPMRPTRIYGSDLSNEALRIARGNLGEAGLLEAVRLKQADVLALSPPADEGVLVVNPPYGVRIGDQNQLAELYPRLGDALKQRFGGWNCYIFSGDPRLPKLIHLHASRRIPLFNGPLECRLLEYKMTPSRAARPE